VQGVCHRRAEVATGRSSRVLRPCSGPKRRARRGRAGSPRCRPAGSG